MNGGGGGELKDDDDLLKSLKIALNFPTSAMRKKRKQKL